MARAAASTNFDIRLTSQSASPSAPVTLAERRERLRRLANSAICLEGPTVATQAPPPNATAPIRTSTTTGDAAVVGTKSPQRRELRRLEDLLRVAAPRVIAPRDSHPLGSASVGAAPSSHSVCGTLRLVHDDSLAWTHQRFRRLSNRSVGTAATPRMFVQPHRFFPASPADPLDPGPDLLVDRTPSRRSSGSGATGGAGGSSTGCAAPGQIIGASVVAPRASEPPPGHTHVAPFNTSPAAFRRLRSVPPVAIDEVAPTVRDAVFDGRAYLSPASALPIDSVSDAQRIAIETTHGCVAADEAMEGVTARYSATPAPEDRSAGKMHFDEVGAHVDVGDPWLLLSAAQAALQVSHTQIRTLESALEAERAARKAAEMETAEARLEVRRLSTLMSRSGATGRCTAEDTLGLSGVA